MIGKKRLYNLYWKKGLSYAEIGKIYDVTRHSIYYWFKKYNIPRRSKYFKKMHYIYKSCDLDSFSKSYILGFCIGDCTVIENKAKIIVKTGSTKRNQIKLVENLFKPFGYIGKTKSQKQLDLYIHLDESFKFLISKEVPIWIKEDFNNMRYFVAGYFDAEGWISRWKEKGRYKYHIGFETRNDFTVLLEIFFWLKKYKFLDKVNINSYIRGNKVRYLLRMTKLKNIKRFIEIIPFRHESKRKFWEKCRKDW